MLSKWIPSFALRKRVGHRGAEAWGRVQHEAGQVPGCLQPHTCLWDPERVPPNCQFRGSWTAHGLTQVPTGQNMTECTTWSAHLGVEARKLHYQQALPMTQGTPEPENLHSSPRPHRCLGESLVWGHRHRMLSHAEAKCHSREDAQDRAAIAAHGLEVGI